MTPDDIRQLLKLEPFDAFAEKQRAASALVASLGASRGVKARNLMTYQKKKARATGVTPMTPKKKRVKDAPLKNFVVWVDEVYRTAYEARARDADHAVALVKEAAAATQPGTSRTRRASRSSPTPRTRAADRSGAGTSGRRPAVGSAKLEEARRGS